MAIRTKQELFERLVALVRSDGQGGKTRASQVRELFVDTFDTMFSLASYTTAPTKTTVGGLVAGSTHNGTIKSLLDRILNPLTLANVFLSANLTIFEKGTTANVNLVANVVPGDDTTWSEFELTKNNVLLVAAAPGVTTINRADAITTTTAYVVSIKRGNGAYTTDWRTVTPVAPSYHGVMASNNPTEAQLKEATKSVVTEGSRTISFTSNNQHPSYAYPAIWGDLLEIRDQSLFVVNSSFTTKTETWTLADGTTESMNIYTLTNPAGTGTPFEYRFNF